ncbi:MAG: hypothetical protein Q8M92_08580, partial [Candidatus Subteraquimicrobiales bacterium]|nr:hypothetical protein [Candidatus Subteraquimicrobiales bacterium]
MLKHIGFFTFLWLLLSTSVFGQPALTAQPYEKDYQQIQKGDLKLWGCFDKPCSVDPDQINLFGYSTKYSIVSYHFLGRTGEKTFDILKSETDTSTRSFQTKREIYHLYFVANDLV